MSVDLNIKLRKNNFTVKNGYFYTFDDDQDALLQKTDDGNTAFSYPCDTLLDTTVISLEFDGVYFWSLEDNSGSYSIKKWKIDNYICKLQQNIDLDFGSSHHISTNAFTVEHYHTSFSTTVSGGETTIYINDYYNKPNVINNVTLHLGPNSNGEEEDIDVSGVVFGGVTLSSPVQYAYGIGDEINFHRRIWLFNNYNGTDSSTGALYKLNSSDGGYMDKYPGGAYKNIKACTFYKISSFSSIGPTDMLVYAKGTNTLFVDIEENKKTLYDADTVNDTFTGSDGSFPNSSWYVAEDGSPTIESNKLYLDLSSIGSEGIKTKYYLDGDFDVYVDGDLSSYDSSYAGSEYYQHSLVLMFPSESDRFCKVSRGYSTEFGDLYYQNFSSITRLSSDTVVSGVSAQSGSTFIDNYSLRIKRVGSDVHFYYRTVVSGVTGSWESLGMSTMFTSDAQLLLMATTSLNSTFNTNFDNLTYNNGKVAFLSAATELPYYGSMVMDNIENDEYTIDPLDGMSIDRNNLYRLHDSSNTYNYALSPLESFVTSISLSASPAIIAANGLSTTDIKAWVKDQFLQPVVGRRVTFSENGDGSIVGNTQVNTDSNGYATTIYQAGTTAQDVVITAVVQQTN